MFSRAWFKNPSLIDRIKFRLFGRRYIGIDCASGEDKTYKTTILVFRGKMCVISTEVMGK